MDEVELAKMREILTVIQDLKLLLLSGGVDDTNSHIVDLRRKVVTWFITKNINEVLKKEV